MGANSAPSAQCSSFFISAYKYLRDRRETHYWKEFEVFHKLVQELVQPASDDQTMYIDRQAAIIFELQNFKRYYPYSLRMLHGLRTKWNTVPSQFPRLLEELDLTIKYLERRVNRSVRSWITTQIRNLFAYRRKAAYSSTHNGLE